MTGIATPSPVTVSNELPANRTTAPLPSVATRVVVFVGLVILAVIVLGAVIALVVRGSPEVARQPVVQIAPLALAFLTAHAIMERRFHRDGGVYAGLDRGAMATRVLLPAAGIGVVAIGVPSLLLLAAGELRVQPAPADASTPQAVGMLLLLLIPAALWEELAFRGYLFSALRERAGAAWALITTSLLFGAVHLTNTGATVLSTAAVALAGIFLGLVRLSSGSLYAAWAAHLAWNLTMAIGLRTPVSGTNIALSGYQTVDNGPDWLTGGAWGPEGGAAAMVGIGLASWYLWRRLRREERTT